MAEQATPKKHWKKWLTFTLRWGIAVIGIWWVLSQITWRDRVTLLGPNNRPAVVRLADVPPLEANEFHVLKGNKPLEDGQTVLRSELVSLPDVKKVRVDS